MNILINGGKRLSGEINVSGAKNSVVALIPAALLCKDEVILENVPDISDTYSLMDILKYLNVDVSYDNHVMRINSKNLVYKDIPVDYASKLRASYYFMGVLLGLYKKVSMSFPGGCSIGARPIDLHLKGFEKLGSEVIFEDEAIKLDCKRLVGDDIFLDVPSVGATINIMLASVLAGGKTVIRNAAMEPEIGDVANFLNSMGANISGIGTRKIIIHGVDSLHGCTYSVIPDRIEAGTYVIIASLLGDDLKVSGLIPEHIESLTSKLIEAGVKLDIGNSFVRVRDISKYNAIDIKTVVYPGFPTDLQQIIIPFLTQCNGISHVEETIYENRYLNIPDTVRMGAIVDVFENRYASIYGTTKLVGKKVKATDLRGGASMIVCGLIADGETEISNIGHILRGYENLIDKLSKVGADIKLVK